MVVSYTESAVGKYLTKDDVQDFVFIISLGGVDKHWGKGAAQLPNQPTNQPTN